MSLESCTSWGQSSGLAGNKPTVIRSKDTSPQPGPRDSGRRGCGDGRSHEVGGETKGERGESGVMEMGGGSDEGRYI